MDGLNEMDFRTTDRCVKNDQNWYRPVWLPNDSSIKREVIKLMAKRIEVMEGERPAQAGDQPQSVDMNDSFEVDLVLISMIWATCRMAAPKIVLGTAVEQVSRSLDKYAQHSKGYVPLQLVVLENYFLSLRQRIQLQIK